MHRRLQSSLFWFGITFLKSVSLAEVLHGWPNIYQKWHPVATYSKLIPDVHLVEISVFFLCCSAILCFGKENENFYFGPSRFGFKCVFLHINRVWQLWFGKWKMNRVLCSKEGLLKTQGPSYARCPAMMCTQCRRVPWGLWTPAWPARHPAGDMARSGSAAFIHPLVTTRAGEAIVWLRPDSRSSVRWGGGGRCCWNQWRGDQMPTGTQGAWHRAADPLAQRATVAWHRGTAEGNQDSFPAKQIKSSCQKPSSLSSNVSQALPLLVAWGMLCYFPAQNQRSPLRRWEEWPVLGKQRIFIVRMCIMVVHMQAFFWSWTPHLCPDICFMLYLWAKLWFAHMPWQPHVRALVIVSLWGLHLKSSIWVCHHLYNCEWYIIWYLHWNIFMLVHRKSCKMKLWH